MTAQLLPSLHPSPFGSKLEDQACGGCDSISLHSAPAHPSPTSFNTVLIQKSRQASPASFFSTASAPVPANNENAAPNSLGVLLGQLSLQSASAVTVLNKTPSLLNQSRSTLLESVSLRSIPTQLASEDQQGKETSAKLQLGKNKDHSIHHNVGINERAPAARARWPAKPKARLQDVSDLESASTEVTPLRDQSPSLHSKRHSATSSGFVHTVKTASFSGGSLSILSKSLGLTLSTESHGPLGSRSRFSTDSDRPATASSVDEDAIKRSVRRRQILEEITRTEESYIADLKALVCLMSTLLTSATSVPSRTRHAVHRNVIDLLHLHEGILDNLHRAAFKAAARKWADTVSPRRLGSPRHLRWRSLEPQPKLRFHRKHRRTRSSMDSTEITRARARLMAAEPVDVVDVVTIFTSSISSFFSYEEYCANHEVLASDLQRHLPALWTAYGAGMESLGRMLVSLEQRETDSKKGMSVGDLLVKPIQRVCRYPLLFEELLRQTPVADCPSTHSEVQYLLHSFRNVVHAVNSATGNGEARLHIQRRSALQNRLDLEHIGFPPAELRSLGHVVLCGILFLIYQTSSKIDGAYVLCILYEHVFVVAMPVDSGARFEVMAMIKLSDMKLESVSDGKGLQCPSAFHTWKLCFALNANLHEFVLSACSAIEEEQWKRGLRGELVKQPNADLFSSRSMTTTTLELRSTGMVYGHHESLTRRLSVQRAATVNTRASICQVIIKNTHNPEGLHEFRQPSTSTINRSQSHMTTNRVIVLAPKRSERARLESILADVWTKDKLPFPGITASRGGQIIRASAGSLARKLSLASIHGPFSRRSASLTVSSKKSYETFSESERHHERIPTFQIRRDSFSDKPTPKLKRKTSHDVPELDTMDSVVNRMIADTVIVPKNSPSSKDDGVKRKGTLRKRTIQSSSPPVGPDDSAQAFYAHEDQKSEQEVKVEEELTGKRKRWSNPIGVLKGRAAESLRHMLYSSKQ